MEKYKIEKYISKLNDENNIKEILNIKKEEFDKKVEYISYNSKDIKNDTLFICKGASFKKEYLEQAIFSGATIYMSEVDYKVNIPAIVVNDIKKAMSVVATIYYNNPQNDLNIIGITGTKGKSTTTYYLKSILDEYANKNSKKDTAVVSTIDTYLGKETFKSFLTTPENLDLIKDFFIAKENNIKNLVMEVSSQALKYDRVYKVNFETAIFTNISEDHISPIEHPDFDDYFNSKLKIFEKCKNACINLDADFSDVIYKKAKEKAKQIVTYSVSNKDADIYAYDIKKDGLNTVFKVKSEKFLIDDDFLLSMPGLFNVENAMAAISCACLMNIPVKYIKDGLKNARVKGRMQIVKSDDGKIISIIDYAHNKVSFEKIFETVKKEYNDRKIITVFGCPGSKAQIRRKDLGEVSSLNSDYIVITEDDPQYEDTESICLEIANFVKINNKNYKIIINREEAIKYSVEFAKKMDEKVVLLLLGKGDETAQKVLGKKVEYGGDFKIVSQYI